MNKIIFSVYLFFSSAVFAQPFLDLGKVFYAYTPLNGLNKKNNPLRSDLYNINLSVPVELQKNGNAIIVNPFFEHNDGKISGNSFQVISEGLSAGFLNKFKNTNWSIYAAFILRRNKETEENTEDAWQFGGISLASFEKNKSFTLKFGLYYNKEFFGNFFMPLLVLDWRINAKNNLFGVLPGNMTFEHKVSRSFYFGGVFRALTSSYRLTTEDPCAIGDCSGKNYLRINDNQAGIYSDIYLIKNVVFTTELGYTAFRNYRYGFKGKVLHNYTDYKNDNYYFRLSLSYRLRIR